MSIEYKSLIFSTLWKPLIFRVFASEGKSARKYSLIFRGISENSDRKIKIRLQSESGPYRFNPSRKNDADSWLNPNRSLEFSLYFWFILSVFSLDFLPTWRAISRKIEQK